MKSTAPRTSSAFLQAWDPVNQREVWRSQPLGGVGSGILSTAGRLVFQGSPKGEFAAYRDSDGRKLWSTDPQTGVVAAPISYEVDGEQYIAQLAGFGTRDYYSGNRSRLLVYKLGGRANLPEPEPLPPPRVLNPVAQFGTPDIIKQGDELFAANCMMCHETAYGNRGLFPDLRFSPLINSADAFKTVVIDGALQARGMVSFKDRFDADAAESIRAYLTMRAHQAMAQGSGPGR
jgi:alcohol dehydrogenase (cytochrome c)/quinohemoprotein ethanol dehydrogenase